MSEPATLCTVRQEVGLRLKEKREQKGLSLAAMANFLGISVRTYERIEQGKGVSKELRLFAIAVYLDSDPLSLLPPGWVDHVQLHALLHVPLGRPCPLPAYQKNGGKNCQGDN